MGYTALFISILLISFSCNNNSDSKAPGNTITRPHINPYTCIRNIPLPEGYVRTVSAENSFAFFLRNCELKKDKTVYLFNRKPKYNQSAQFAVLDISVGNKDLQQCADAVMRLRAEFFYAQQAFGQIVFYDNANTAYSFSSPYTRNNFTSYLNRVFGMCGSASLSKHLNHVPDLKEIKPGDVLIRGGFPGHAALVMDVALNAAGKKIYLLAQSYMPAQDIHILNNPCNKSLSPWYDASVDSHIIQTPEYSFTRNELKRW